MSDVSAPTPVFARGSAVLDYWLTRPEGLTVQPLNAPVERAVGPTPFGPAVALVVRKRNGRERRIPAADIVAVDPAKEELFLALPEDAGDPVRARVARGVAASARRLTPRAVAASRRAAVGARSIARRYSTRSASDASGSSSSARLRS